MPKGSNSSNGSYSYNSSGTNSQVCELPPCLTRRGTSADNDCAYDREIIIALVTTVHLPPTKTRTTIVTVSVSIPITLHQSAGVETPPVHVLGNGSYYYSNPNGSTYYNDGKGSSTYTPASSGNKK